MREGNRFGRRERGKTHTPGLSWLPVLLAGAALTGPAGAAESLQAFHRDGVLGTSFDVKVNGTTEDLAVAAEKAAFDETQRLAKILWTGDPKSEIARLGASKGPFQCSKDLWAVVHGCNMWRTRTGGAFTPHAGALIDLWKQAGKTGSAPPTAKIREATTALRKQAWRLLSQRKVQPLGPLHLDVSGLAKGYIAGRALAAARAAAPGAKGLLVNLGGDIAAWGTGPDDQTGWLVDIADPFHPAENEPPLTTVRVANRAVATSGSYARNITVAGKRHSHILNPLTGQPADLIVGATVVAPDPADADAAATAMCVLSPARGLALVNLLKGVDCMIVDAKGQQFASRGWPKLVVQRSSGGQIEPPPGPGEQPVASEGGWPKGYGVQIRVGLKSQRKRPNFAVWMADERGRPVKMLALWGHHKYNKKLRSFSALGSSFQSTARSVSRASPRPGVYALAWNGTDSRGRPVEPGKYTVNIEIIREKGRLVLMTGTVACGTAKADSARMHGNAESDGAEVKYGPTGT